MSDQLIMLMNLSHHVTSHHITSLHITSHAQQSRTLWLCSFIACRMLPCSLSGRCHSGNFPNCPPEFPGEKLRQMRVVQCIVSRDGLHIVLVIDHNLLVTHRGGATWLGLRCGRIALCVECELTIKIRITPLRIIMTCPL